MTFERGQDYSIHGTTLSAVARLVADGNHVKPGVHFLADAVNPVLD